MSKEETFQDLSLNPPSGEQDLWRWLYTELRGAILDGRLKPGTRMPSTRSLGAQYSLSRGTVVVAFDQLQAEGYTRTEVGSGTYVASGVPDAFLSPTRKPATVALPSSKAAFPKRTKEFLKGVEVLPASHTIGKAFRTYEPAIDLFPVDLWARVASRVLRRAPRSLYGHGAAAGYQPLRRAIAEYVGASRGVHCSAEQIIVTSGTQQALDLIGRFLLATGDRVWMEDPGYSGALQTLRTSGARIVPIPVDEDGLIVSAGRRLASKAKLAYVTPANQFPMGVTMSADRRLDLLRWATNANAWIIEDDYDAEYRYSGRPVAALQALDSSGCVIYVGTFTKMLFNALRLGFMVLPERLVEAFASARTFVDRHPPTLDQAILAEFITEGHFGHHLRRMRQIYAERIEVLKTAADEHLDGLVDVVRAGAGVRTLGWLKTWKSDHDAAQQARKFGLEVEPLSLFTTKYNRPPALMLGFAGCTSAELRRGVSLLATALRSH
ncbi:PLP-dependent aminotransferase family protein [Edaphobacter sp. 12200R-103]|jgi:GntR family transcriptional regulator/MocR family aminotransferase|uniref:MocR-like pyridoxine biosynthesis transcription factor PdxR n=1 Tax=Edaphobacter sp. 12200R-103 TaxID=2703788 RepID=UPI00138BE178|nr:PLP-dependent aminotransferase family protein [Edaphobacter sp. 12200R-103]QHS53152.1 PLP-dependent aminotransferase family protein [Edaphobacter sp. 12200R-103]